jgi:hypothetical protein
MKVPHWPISKAIKWRVVKPVGKRGRLFYSFELGHNYHRSLAEHLWLYRVPNKKSKWMRNYLELNNRKGKYRHISCKRNVR